MAVLVEHISPTTTSTQKPQPMNGLVRHASAPACPQLMLSHSEVEAGQQQRNKHSSSGSSRHSASTSTSNSRLLRQLSAAQVIVCRLHRDRGNWRANAQRQESRLLANEQALQQQQHANALLEDQYAFLCAEHRASVATNNKLLEQLQTAVTSQEKLIEQVKDLERAIARLKKSDRAKGKVWQRNLRLKATLHQYATHTDLDSSSSNANLIETLQEALALASGRIEELETKGEAFLDALEGSDNSGEDQEEDEESAKLLESTIAFRGVLEDETCREIKEHWLELLGD